MSEPGIGVWSGVEHKKWHKVSTYPSRFGPLEYNTVGIPQELCVLSKVPFV